MNTWEITFELAAACGCYPVLPSVMLNLNARPQSVQENNCSKETVVILDVKASQTPPKSKVPKLYLVGMLQSN